AYPLAACHATATAAALPVARQGRGSENRQRDLGCDIIETLLAVEPMAAQHAHVHKEAIMPATQTFVEQLRQARDATHSKHHPYFQKWAQGELTKKQIGYYLVMHYHFVTQYLNWLAHIWAHCPVDEVKRHI